VYASARALDGSDGGIGVSNIWFENADGSGATPLTQLTVADASFPAWSPDGTKVAYISARRLDGANGVNGFNFNQFFFIPVPNIWLMNADGSGSTPVTRFSFGTCLDSSRCFTPLSPFGELLPATWSPDGRMLAFLSGQALDGSNQMQSPTGMLANLWTINADGSGATSLPTTPAA
jgi:Tol biopolymer transport system component